MRDLVHGENSVVWLAEAMLIFGVVQCSALRCLADDAQQAAIAKGLGYVALAGEKWIDKRGCVSCHQVTSLLWSHTAAAAYVDAASATNTAQWLTWSTQVENFVAPEAKENVEQHATMDANVDTMARLLLAVPHNSDATVDQAWRDKFANHLAAMQQANGTWNACGQLPSQKRPENETQAATTLWVALALEQEGTKYDQAACQAFVDAIKDPVSTEWYAARILLAKATGEQELLTQSCKHLLQRQNEDGGWGWLHAQKSDALGTGYALYALKRVGCSADKAMASAAEFLVSTQEDDGRWRVSGTKRSAKGRATATANDWGTAWAVVALATKLKQVDNTLLNRR